MNPPPELLDFLKKSDNFLIASHINPDGDAIGSSNALSMLLRAMGKKTALLLKDPFPYQYSFLPGAGDFLSFKSYSNKASNSENLILLDCNETKRAGIGEPSAPDLNFHKIAVIDHHETSKSFGDIRWIVPEAPATGLMVYSIIKHLDIKITKEIATNLYTAISFDTGNFRYENTTPEVFRAAADLTDAGAKPHLLYSSLFEKWTLNRFKLLIDIMGSLELEDGIAIALVTKEMFENTSTSADDTESFVTFPRVLDDVKVSAIIRETGDNYLRVSLRSKSGVDVARIAEAFGGGGHKNAAGFRIQADIQTIKENLKKIIKDYLESVYKPPSK